MSISVSFHVPHPQVDVRITRVDACGAQGGFVAIEAIDKRCPIPFELYLRQPLLGQVAAAGLRVLLAQAQGVAGAEWWGLWSALGAALIGAGHEESIAESLALMGQALQTGRVAEAKAACWDLLLSLDADDDERATVAA